MTSTTEAGLVKNITNFTKLIEFIHGYGPVYNPSQEQLQLPALESLLADAKDKFSFVEISNTTYLNKVHERQKAFANLRQFFTRLINAISITEAPVQTLNAAKALNRKMNGRRATPKSSKPLGPNQKPRRKISVSQQSFHKQIQHFSNLVSIIKTIPSYKPNEEELKVVTLESLLVALSKLNDEVVAAYAQVSNARIVRNKILFAKENSIHSIAMAAKRYIKIIYDRNSQEYTQVSGLRFSSMKKI